MVLTKAFDHEANLHGLCLAKTSILFEISVMFWRLILK